MLSLGFRPRTFVIGGGGGGRGGKICCYAHFLLFSDQFFIWGNLCGTGQQTASGLAFFQEFFQGGKIYCYANFFCYGNFSVVFGANLKGCRGL